MIEPIICPISQTSMEPVFTELVLNKYKVKYFYCNECGLLKTEKPFWFNEAYESAISLTDTGILKRNIENSVWAEQILECLFIEKGKFVDVAGGYGLLTRLMRDKGFDFYTTDKYCQNLFAKTFEPDSHFTADALFAFEVLEHIEDPYQFLRAVFDKYGSKTITFSTLTFTGTIPSSDWEYYSFEDGLHITFYQPRTLSYLADRLKCNYYKINSGLHIITDKKLSTLSSILLFNSKARRLFYRYINRKRKGLSKTWEDHLAMKEKLKSN